MTSPFGKSCPRKSCKKKIVRATGDTESKAFSVRCEADHRFAAKRDKNGKLTLSADSDDESLAALEA